MKKSLRKKITFSLLFFIIIFLIILETFIYEIITEEFENSFKTQKTSLAIIIKKSVTPAYTHMNIDYIQDVLESLKEDNDFLYCAIYNFDNSRYTYKLSDRYKKSIPQDYEMVKEESGYLMLKLPLISTRYLNMGSLGNMVIAFDRSNLQQKKMMLLIYLVLLFVVIVISIMIILQIVLNRTVLKKIEQLSDASKMIASGDLNTQLDLTSDDEIGELADNFRKMTSQLNEKLEDIKATNLQNENLKYYFNNIINNSPNGIMTLTIDGVIKDYNPAFQEIFEVKSDLKGYNLFQYNQDFDFLKPEIKDVLMLDKIYTKKDLNFYFKGKQKYIDLLMYSSGSGFKTVVLTFIDHTEKTLLEKQLIQSQKMEAIGNLAGGIAHDFNNILGGIIGSCNLVQLYLESNKNLDKNMVSKHLSTIEYSAQRASETVKNLLSLSRKQEINPMEFDLRKTLKHVVKVFRSGADKSIEIMLDLPDTKAFVFADVTLIEQVLLNLCVNAGHAMTIMRKSKREYGGILDLRLSLETKEDLFLKNHPEAKESSYWCITINDTGVGIPAENLSRIFEPFFTTKGIKEGSGLGLSMVYGILQKHNGFIDVSSIVGVGTKFRLYLPAYDNSIDIKNEADKKLTLVHGRGKVLVIDDEKVMTDTLKSLLNSLGFEVIIASNGIDALQIYEEEDFELVVLDLVMPKLSGIETLKRIKEINTSAKVILISGSPDKERLEEARKIGYSDFIKKPFSIHDMSDVLKRVLKD